MKSSDKSSSTNSLYEFAEELAEFNKTSSNQEMKNTAQTDNSAMNYSMEFPTNARAHNHSGEIYDIVD